nr:phage minor capsid protein [uncultured Ruminococcus sp.]
MSEEYDLSRAFERIENYLIDSMMRNFKHHRAEETAEGYNWEQWQAKQIEALEEYSRNNQEKFSAEFAELNDRVGEMLRSTADDAGYRQEQKILKAIQKGFTTSRPSSTMQASFFKLNERKMNALIRSTTDDLSRAEFAVLRRSNDAYRKAIFGAQIFMNSGAATYEQAVDMATKDMLSAGLQCVEYSNGARHTLHDYAEMAIRTANKRAYLRGEGVKMQEWGITTVIINRRHGACGRCADFVGMVFIDDVYAGGKPSDHGGKYPLLSDAMKSGLFHPRCKDNSSLYIEGISTPPDREVLPKKAQEDLTEIERAEQRAAYGKRMEKMNRRLSKYALDPDNKKMYRGRAEQWAEYTEKWQSYHEKQLAKAEKSGIIKENTISKNSIEESVSKTSKANGFEITNKKTDHLDVGSSAFTSENRQKMLEAERIISGNSYETAIVYDSKGNVVFSQKGKSNEVEFTAKQLKQMEGCVVTHNHPLGTVFSAEDIEIMRKTHLSEIRACNHYGSYVLRRNGNWNSGIRNYKAIREEYDKCMRQAENKVLDELAQEGRRITRRDFQRMNENGMELFCKKFDLVFSWEDKV